MGIVENKIELSITDDDKMPIIWYENIITEYVNIVLYQRKLIDKLENETQEHKKSIQEHIQLIQTYTDDERILAQCNLILKELEDE